VEESRGTPSLVEGSVKQVRRHRIPSFVLGLLVMCDQKYLVSVRRQGTFSTSLLVFP